MDVRCEKCGTEYELDDNRVTEAGVTVKCTSCGHLFRVKRTREEPTRVRAVSQQPLPFGANLPENSAVTVEAQLWLLKAPNGELDRFRDLQTLQQWIVQRKVSRDHQISRTGETWKRLGDIAELASFFLVVDQAEAALRGADGNARRSSTLQGPPHPVPVPPAPPRVTPSPAAPASAPVSASASTAPTPPVPIPAAASAPPPLPPPSPPRAAATPPPPPAHPPAPAVDPAARTLRADVTTSGPTGGLQGAPVVEPAWASGAGSVERARQQIAARPTDSQVVAAGADPSGSLRAYADDEDEYAPRSKLPFIVLGVLLVGGGAAAGIYFLARGDGRPKVAQPAPTTPPAPPAPVVAVDAARAAPPIVESPGEKAYEQGVAKLYEDTDEAWAESEKLLEQAQVADPEQKARVLAAMALLNSTIAQVLLDEADGLPPADRRVAEQKRAEASRRRVRAETFARDALAASARSSEALVALADARRLGGAASAEVEKHLKAAEPHVEVPYVRAMLRFRDRKVEEAKTLLHAVVDAHKLRTGHEHLRARYHLALIALAEKRPEEVQAQVTAILAAQPAHARAKALGERAAQAAAAAAATPSSPPSGGGEGSAPAEPAGYDGLVARGNKLAENDRCPEALKLFDKAYDVRPGVEALMGQGYCYMDLARYGEAVGKFRAALAMAPKNGDAIMGLADAFREQGKLGEAAEQYQRYVDTHPTGPFAARAKKWARELGGSAPTPPPTPPPPEKPPEKPPEEKPPVEKPPEDKLPDKPSSPAPEQPAEPASPP